jgi:PEGA domain
MKASHIAFPFPFILRSLLLGLLISSCAPAPIPPTTVSLRMTGSPPDATVTIDDQILGALAFVQARGVALPPGKHRVTVQAQGFFPWDKEVEAKEGSPPIRLDVALVPIPD